MKKIAALVLAATVGLLIAGCATNKGPLKPAKPVLSGIVNYRARIALSPRAVLTVRLLDVSKADAPPVVLSERSISNPGNPPMAFELSYPFGGIQASRHYVIDARIEVAGRPQFYSATPQVVTPQNAGESHEIMLELAAGN